MHDSVSIRKNWKEIVHGSLGKHVTLVNFIGVDLVSKYEDCHFDTRVSGYIADAIQDKLQMVVVPKDKKRPPKKPPTKPKPTAEDVLKDMTADVQFKGKIL